MTEKRYYIGNGENCTICDKKKGGSDFFNMLTQFQAVDKLNELYEENQKLKSKFEFEETDIDYVLSLLKRTIDELKYFIKDYEEDEIDITVHSLIRDVDLLLGNKQDIFSGYISFIIDCNEDLEKENKELRSDMEYWKTLAQSLAKNNGNVKVKDEHLAWKRVDVE